MDFRPCIDIHNGSVKQIVGSSLRDAGDMAVDNFVSEQDGAFYANLYKEAGIKGGHIILLNPASSEYYEKTKAQAVSALQAYPGGLQVGGGITADNAAEFIELGASHVIVTSYVFKDGKVNYENLKKIYSSVGKEHLVLDLSCRFKDDGYYIVTDRWQKFTNEKITYELLDELSSYCDEFLIHAVDVEGKIRGIDENVAELLGKLEGMKVTYAGGIGSFSDIEKLEKLGQGKVDFTVGSALDIFGGSMSFEKVCAYK